MTPIPTTLLTIFTTCKAFKNDAGVMQKNALKSWRALQQADVLPFDITIMGNDEGSLEAAEAIDATHIADIATNEAGVPLVNAMFEEAKTRFPSPFLAYINSDIILQKDFLETVASLLRKPMDKPFLLTSRRINIPLSEPLVGDCDHWQSSLSEITDIYGSWDLANAVDLFLFSRELFQSIPPFAIGRMQWDNWLLWKAREEKAMVIDASLDFALLHPIHGYTSHAGGWHDVMQGKSSKKNRDLAKGQLLDLNSATTHVIKNGELEPVTDELRQTIEHSCAPSPTREISAFLHQLSRYEPIPTNRETADIFRTLLWRNERFVPQRTLEILGRDFGQAIDMAINYVKNGNLEKGLDALQDALANHLLVTLNKQIANNRPVVVWGTGNLAKRLKHFLDRHRIRVTGFADSDKEKAGQVFLGLPVLGSTATEIAQQTEKRPFFVIGSMYVREICDSLSEHGFVAPTDITS